MKQETVTGSSQSTEICNLKKRPQGDGKLENRVARISEGNGRDLRCRVISIKRKEGTPAGGH